MYMVDTTDFSATSNIGRSKPFPEGTEVWVKVFWPPTCASDRLDQVVLLTVQSQASVYLSEACRPGTLSVHLQPQFESVTSPALTPLRNQTLSDCLLISI